MRKGPGMTSISPFLLTKVQHWAPWLMKNSLASHSKQTHCKVGSLQIAVTASELLEKSGESSKGEFTRWETPIKGHSKEEGPGEVDCCRHNFLLSTAICQLTEQARRHLLSFGGGGQNDVFSCFPVSHGDWAPSGCL